MTTQPQVPLKVIVVGGSIAGLSVARCLGELGHNIVVLEAASEVCYHVSMRPS